MDINEETRNGILVLKPAGRVDSGTAGAFETRLVQAVNAGQASVVVDMAQLAYISSAGLRALLVAAKRARPAGSRIVLAAMSASIREVFDMSGFTSLFEIHTNADAAIQALS
ncbi:STAS domain-containing protein [Azospirillum halopraeferens]|uniref:STAS domain-containing protein n=1 Tax=Azospirillum halopraeferens TaxID=34010 RepID=UPI00040EB3D4|nr:STAS domain-containing protein [Azospirillum halopraeferens]